MYCNLPASCRAAFRSAPSLVSWLAPALALSLTAAAQAPVPFTVSTPSGTLAPGNLYGFGDTSSRLLCQGNPVTGLRPIGYFDAAVGGSFVELVAPLVASSVENIVWEHSATTPASAWFIQNDAPAASSHSVLYQALIAPGGTYLGTNQYQQISSSNSETWTIDGSSTPNDVFFLRRTNGTGANVYRCGTSGFPVLLVPSNADRALGPISVFANTSLPGVTIYQLAYMTQPAVGAQRIAFVTYTSSGSVSGPITYPVSTGTTLQDLTWIDAQFLVARSSSTATPNHANLVRINRLNPNPPGFIEDLTLPGLGNMNVGSLAISGDRQWLTWRMQQTVAANETCVAAMRVDDGITTAPGGAYAVVQPLETWSFSGKPYVQQTANPVNPTLVYYGSRTSSPTLPASFYRANLKYDVTVVGRLSTLAPPSPNPGTTNFSSFVATANHDAQNDMWILGVSLVRTNPAPGVYIDSSLILGPWFITPIGFFNSSSPTITLGTTPAPLNACLFMQAGWFTQGNLTLGRVTELPIF